MESLLVAFSLAVLLFVIGSILYFLQGPQFVPSGDASVSNIVALAKPYIGKKLIDLGSGNGKLVVALSQAGLTIDGIELNPWLVLLSRRKIRKMGLQNNIHIYWGSFWHFPLSSYDGVVIYGIKHIMYRLSKKLEQELPEYAVVISNFFVFPTWKTQKKLGKILLYTMHQ